jgi:cytochrome c oxidase subunit 4
MSDQANAHATEHHIDSARTYFIVWALLIFATVLTTAVAFVDLGFFSVVVALVIACCKMLLVVLFFMHARFSSQLTKLTLFAGVLWLLILLSMISLDFMTRPWMGVPGR